eukprot:6213375-Pleurochrysis_carterae.AAC.3
MVDKRGGVHGVTWDTQQECTWDASPTCLWTWRDDMTAFHRCSRHSDLDAWVTVLVQTVGCVVRRLVRCTFRLSLLRSKSRSELAEKRGKDMTTSVTSKERKNKE